MMHDVPFAVKDAGAASTQAGTSQIHLNPNADSRTRRKPRKKSRDRIKSYIDSAIEECSS
jgi:hypothetical protein